MSKETVEWLEGQIIEQVVMDQGLDHGALSDRIAKMISPNGHATQQLYDTVLLLCDRMVADKRIISVRTEFGEHLFRAIQ